MGGIFNAQGPIAGGEGHLIIIAVLIMLTVAIPLLIALYVIAWRYRARGGDDGKRAAKYDPEHTGNVWRQLVWWAIPAVIIAVISVIDWQTTHALDPFKAIAAPSATAPSGPVPGISGKPLEIQVIALEWKWLFIYPQQGIATVNYIKFPVGTPVHFDLTADAPMSSFWIPELGSQIYAMAAMQTQLNLLASTTGAFEGKDTEINGEGYAGMTFEADSVTQNEFNNWVLQVRHGSNEFTMDDYNALAEPSSYTPTSSYAAVDPSLYGYVLMKYMAPTSSATTDMSAMPGMQM